MAKREHFSFRFWGLLARHPRFRKNKRALSMLKHIIQTPCTTKVRLGGNASLGQYTPLRLAKFQNMRWVLLYTLWRRRKRFNSSSICIANLYLQVQNKYLTHVVLKSKNNNIHEIEKHQASMPLNLKSHPHLYSLLGPPNERHTLYHYPLANMIRNG